jgi:predicted P-loop ATPase
VARSSVPPSAAGLPTWYSLLQLNDKGNPLAILSNAIIPLERDSAFSGAFRYDQFRGEVMICAPLPWDQYLATPRPWHEKDRIECCIWLQDKGLRVGELIAESAARGVAYRSTYHPVVDYLSSLAWDGVPRIDTWLYTYCGVDFSRYSEAVGPRYLISAVARVLRPGVKADCALVLEGPEGIYKSTVFEVLGSPWYSNDIAALGTKDAQQQLLGKWIIELDELDAVSRASDWAAVKAFISRGTDHYRRSYRRDPEDLPRQCVFGGTTNTDLWARDPTGLRRFWPAKCGHIDIRALRRDKDQLFAEAVVAFYKPSVWWLDDDELIELAREQQMARHDVDPWEWDVLQYISGKSCVTTTEILVDKLRVPLDRVSRAESMRVGSILRKARYVRKFLRHKDKNGDAAPRWWYVHPGYEPPSDC